MGKFASESDAFSTTYKSIGGHIAKGVAPNKFDVFACAASIYPVGDIRPEPGGFWYGHYSVNAKLTHYAFRGTVQCSDTGAFMKNRKSGEVSAPSKAVALIEYGRPGTGWDMGVDNGYRNTVSLEQFLALRHGGRPTQAWINVDRVNYDGGNSMNVGYLDGHAGALTSSDFGGKGSYNINPMLRGFKNRDGKYLEDL